jgi:hypothetical protein
MKQFQDLVDADVVEFISNASYIDALKAVLILKDEIPKNIIANATISLMNERLLEPKTLDLYAKDINRILYKDMFYFRTQNAKTVVKYLLLACIQINPEKTKKVLKQVKKAKLRSLPAILKDIKKLSKANKNEYTIKQLRGEIKQLYLELMDIEKHVNKAFEQLIEIINKFEDKGGKKHG